MKRWNKRPEGSNWGEFGDDDQIGRLNLITRESRLRGVAEVHEGIAFCMSLPLDYPRGDVAIGGRLPPKLMSTPLGHNHHFLDAYPDVVCDDAVTLALQYSTQWDGFSHIGAMFDSLGDGNPVICYYNGYRGGKEIIGDKTGSTEPHADALGIENFAKSCVQGRAVMVNLETAVGHDQTLIGYDQLVAIMQEQKAVIESGDILLLHTGLSRIIMDRGDKLTAKEMNNSCAALDGYDERLLKWITDSGLSAIASDNSAVEVFNLSPGKNAKEVLPLHHHCLFKLGIPLGELWYTTELADWLKDKGRTRFLLTAPPLRLPGAVGSPLSPIATV